MMMREELDAAVAAILSAGHAYDAVSAALASAYKSKTKTKGKLRKSRMSRKSRKSGMSRKSRESDDICVPRSSIVVNDDNDGEVDVKDLEFFFQKLQQQAEGETTPNQMPPSRRRRRLCPACWQLGDINKEVGAAPAEIERHCRSKRYRDEAHHMKMLESTLVNRRGPLELPRSKKN